MEWQKKLTREPENVIVMYIYIPKALGFKKYTVFTPNSAYARKSASLELVLPPPPPFWREMFNERLSCMSTHLFSQKGRSFEK